MNAMRLKRLGADYEKIKAAFADHQFIRVLEAEGKPPEKYQLEYLVDGIVKLAGEELVRSSSHRVEVFLPLDYPGGPPVCRMMTPIFHPNVDPQKICANDHWAAGESLPHLIARIGEIICYQSYNVQSPLNPDAAVWAMRNVSSLPLSAADIWAGI